MGESRHCVYRFYNDGDVLLYVGISCRLAERIGRHKADKQWWPQVERVEIEHCESREEALRRERELIREEKPAYNVQHNVRGAEWTCEECGVELQVRTWGYWQADISAVDGRTVVFDERNADFHMTSEPLVFCDECQDYGSTAFEPVAREVAQAGAVSGQDKGVRHA